MNTTKPINNFIRIFASGVLLAAVVGGVVLCSTSSQVAAKAKPSRVIKVGGPLHPSHALALADAGALGYQSRAGAAPDAYLFVDVECSVCHQAVTQAKNINASILVVPIAIYAPDREQQQLAVIEANTALFRELGRFGLPLWIIRSPCSEPVIVEGSLTEQEQQLISEHVSTECKNGRSPSVPLHMPRTLGVML